MDWGGGESEKRQERMTFSAMDCGPRTGSGMMRGRNCFQRTLKGSAALRSGGKARSRAWQISLLINSHRWSKAKVSVSTSWKWEEMIFGEKFLEKISSTYSTVNDVVNEIARSETLVRLHVQDHFSVQQRVLQLSHARSFWEWHTGHFEDAVVPVEEKDPSDRRFSVLRVVFPVHKHHVAKNEKKHSGKMFSTQDSVGEWEMVQISGFIRTENRPLSNWHGTADPE